ncbi:hypothetical protein ACS0TY_016940 [Phlomoides rotata]
MDLEVEGRHALFFDDDPMAAFVNSADALVEWHSLQIDRYDVRHLLSAPPPPRRRTRNFESKSSDEILIDQERYLDLPSDSYPPEVEDDEKPSASDSYRSVGFSYANTDDSADQKNTDGGMESAGYFPPFPVPGNMVQSLPPTEKVHQIIARTALFVSKNGGQTEIVLRVKQGNNPAFGFLMPDHHLHAYFKYLVEHPELVHSEFDEKSQDERKKTGSEHNNSNSAGGALSLLGSVYGSGEDEDGDDAVNPSATHDTEKVESVENAVKDEPISRKPILFNKENVPAVKKNSSIFAFKPKSLKSTKKDSSGLYSSVEDKSKNNEIGATSKPPILEPPPEFKRLIEKLVEFVMRNGKQFEATLLEQDSKHMRFPFLLPSNQYHPYYIKALQAAQESKENGKSYSGKDDLGGHGIKKKASALGGNGFSHTSDYGDVPFESDRKEKFKMVIGKSRKEEHENQESGVTVDAAAAVAILQAATRGIKNSNSHNHLNRSESGDASLGAMGGTDSSEANLTEEQKRKAERLKKAKMFVAMLKSGAVPNKSGTSRGPSVEPLESGVVRPDSEVNRNNHGRESGVLRPDSEVNHNTHETESSLPPAVVDKPVGTSYLGKKQSERLSERKYRSKTGEDSDREEHEEDEIDKRRRRSHSSEKYKNRGESSEEDRHHKRYKTNHLSHHSHQENDGFEGMYKEERDRKQKRKHRSRSRRYEDDDVGNAVEKERKHRRRRSRSRSSSEESENEEESNESDRELKRYKPMHRPSHHEEERDKKHHESRSRRRHEEENGGESSEDEEDGRKEEKDRKRSRRSHHSRDRSRRSKKHRSHRSKHRHRSRDRESGHRHKRGSSSDDERGELEEGEISPKVEEEEEESRGIANYDRADVTRSSQERPPSQPYDNTHIPDDLRAKIRAMLMVTRS